MATSRESNGDPFYVHVFLYFGDILAKLRAHCRMRFQVKQGASQRKTENSCFAAQTTKNMTSKVFHTYVRFSYDNNKGKSLSVLEWFTSGTFVWGHA